jgi:hypothetical protein
MMPLVLARGLVRAKCQVPLASAICAVGMVVFDTVNSDEAPPCRHVMDGSGGPLAFPLFCSRRSTGCEGGRHSEHHCSDLIEALI